MSRFGQTDFLNEVILFGGAPLRRADVHRHCIAEGFSKKDADAIAFGYGYKTRDEPWSLEEFKALVAQVGDQV